MREESHDSFYTDDEEDVIGYWSNKGVRYCYFIKIMGIFVL